MALRIPSCTIITTEPNSIISPVHDRMPVILKREDEEIWLKNEDPIALKKTVSAIFSFRYGSGTEIEKN